MTASDCNFQPDPNIISAASAFDAFIELASSPSSIAPRPVLRDREPLGAPRSRRTRGQLSAVQLPQMALRAIGPLLPWPAASAMRQKPPFTERRKSRRGADLSMGRRELPPYEERVKVRCAGGRSSGLSHGDTARLNLGARVQASARSRIVTSGSPVSGGNGLVQRRTIGEP